ncbi:unnamed protein product [Orchesella dallaii]|uniref:Odorant receptor n=1 Tax=Orchesella dallaii TaxID=48710 RepID=A0ABP1R6X2_9HEXA
MLLNNGFIVNIQQLIEFDSSWLQLIPLKWNAKERKLTANCKPLSTIFRLFTLSFMCLSALLLLKSCFDQPKTKNSLPQKSLTVLTIAIMLAVASMCWKLHSDHDLIAAVLNNLMDLENDMAKLGKMAKYDSKVKAVQLLSRLLVLTVKYTPILFALSIGLYPNLPTNVLLAFGIGNGLTLNGIFLLEQILLRLAIFVANLLVWNSLCTVSVFVVNEMVVTITCARYYQLNPLNCGLSKLRYGVRSQTGAWIRVSKLQKRLYLLVQAFNEAHAKSIMVQLLLLLSVGQIVCIYTAIRSESMPLALFIPQIVEIVDTHMIIFGVFGCAGHLFDTSEMVIAYLNGQSGLQNDKIIRKLVGALRPLRIEFATANFIDSATPLVFMAFNANRVIDLLLLK